MDLSRPTNRHSLFRRLFLTAFLCLPFLTLASPARPNFVLFIADDISSEDLGCYGHPTISTPHIDRLSAQGLRFTNAYLTTSSCSPSRCSIITGRYPHNTGAPELHTLLPEDQIRFPELLRQHGYHTALSGKNHMFGTPDRAFDLITPGGGPGKEEDWVAHVENRPKSQPFFFWFASSDAHRPWNLSDTVKHYSPEEAVVPPYLVDGPRTREDLAQYYHEVSRFDHYAGQVVAALESQGVLQNTFILVMADNGRPFPRSKTRLYDSGIKTPFVIHFPTVIPRPATTHSLVSAIDISATILDLAAIPKPAPVQGISFTPILQNPEATVRDVVFAEHNWHVHRNLERLVRFGDWLYIRNHCPDQPNLCNEAYKDGAGEELWQTHAASRTSPAQQNIFRNPCPEEELYHTTKDPHQLEDLASEPERSPILEQARALLQAWTDQTGDSIPTNPTTDRDLPARIENGRVLPPQRYHQGSTWTHGEFPGDSTGATTIHHPGPLRRE